MFTLLLAFSFMALLLIRLLLSLVPHLVTLPLEVAFPFPFSMRGDISGLLFVIFGSRDQGPVF